MATRSEAKCVNPDCPANEVWVLAADALCDTCGNDLVGHQESPAQKMADPDQVPDPAGLNRGG